MSSAYWQTWRATPTPAAASSASPGLSGRPARRSKSSNSGYLRQKGRAPSELVVAHILRHATKPIRPVTTRVGNWAATPQQYHSSFDMPGLHTVHGRRSGTAVIDIGGNIIGGHFSVTYSHYSDDGKHFLDGTQTIDGGVQTSTTLTDNLTATDATGKRIGSLHANLTFSRIQPPPPDGDPASRSAERSPRRGWARPPTACRASARARARCRAPLHLQIQDTQAGRSVTVRMTADSHGEGDGFSRQHVQGGGSDAHASPLGRLRYRPCGPLPRGAEDAAEAYA